MRERERKREREREIMMPKGMEGKKEIGKRKASPSLHTCLSPSSIFLTLHIPSSPPFTLIFHCLLFTHTAYANASSSFFFLSLSLFLSLLPPFLHILFSFHCHASFTSSSSIFYVFSHPFHSQFSSLLVSSMSAFRFPIPQHFFLPFIFNLFSLPSSHSLICSLLCFLSLSPLRPLSSLPSFFSFFLSSLLYSLIFA